MMKRKSTQKQTVVVQVYSSKKSTGYRSEQKQWFWDHIEYMPHRSFMCVTDMVISPAPTPAVRPKGRTLSSVSGPCLSLSTWLRIDSASWSALLRLASLRSHEARRGVKSFGSFCRNKSASPAGTKPGNTSTSRWHQSGGTHVQDIHLPSRLPATTKMDSPYTS
jgi:hypothetical protein